MSFALRVAELVFNCHCLFFERGELGRVDRWFKKEPLAEEVCAEFWFVVG